MTTFPRKPVPPVRSTVFPWRASAMGPRMGDESASVRGISGVSIKGTARYTTAVFHLPRRKSSAATTAESENATVTATYTPFGPQPAL